MIWIMDAPHLPFLPLTLRKLYIEGEERNGKDRKLNCFSQKHAIPVKATTMSSGFFFVPKSHDDG
jgi:hypothetical protein